MNRFKLSLALASLASSMVSVAHADTIAWTTWTTSTPGNPGTGLAGGTDGAVAVSYSGQTSGLLGDYPSWTPSGSYIGGTVGNAPPAADNSVQLEGGVAGNETITFSTALVDPVMAIWSLGAANHPASFVFNASEPYAIQAGGPSVEYAGGSITSSGSTVSGEEGNGVIEFIGTYSSITFTTPQYEGYYAFTVGYDTNPAPSATPEPGSLALLGTGLGALAMLRRRFTR